jgi:hypothetical protein
MKMANTEDEPIIIQFSMADRVEISISGLSL